MKTRVLFEAQKLRFLGFTREGVHVMEHAFVNCYAHIERILRYNQLSSDCLRESQIAPRSTHLSCASEAAASRTC
jgi:hypothetical protein